MTSITVRLKGITPIIFNKHIVQGVSDLYDPTNKKLTQKDKAELIEFKYHKNSKGAFLPSDMITGSLASQGQFIKRGSQGNWKSGIKNESLISVIPAEIPFTKDKPKVLEAMVNCGGKKGSSILVFRPLFENWEAEFTVIFNSKFIPLEIVETLLKQLPIAGLGAYRQKFGKSSIEKFEVKEG
jgi:hypothetical protein